MVAWLLGLLTPLHIAPATAVWLLPAGAALTLLLAARNRLARALALYGFGLAWCATMVAAGLSARLPENLAGEWVTLTARVIDLPETDAGTRRFVVEPVALRPTPAILPRRVRLSWYRDAPRVRAGELWRFRARLRRPRGFMNPVRFDYERWLASEHIDATGYVDGGERLAPAAGLAGWRGRIAAHLAARLDGSDGSAVLRALLVGDRRGFSDALWEDLRTLGVSHLVAISGLHIGLVAGIVGLLGAAVWRRLPGAAIRLPTPVAAAVIGLGAAAAYAALAGFALPTRRALIMTAVVVAAVVMRRRPAPLRGLLIAASAVIMFDPWAPLSAGFWLSFSAVAIILFGWHSGLGRLRNTLRIQLLVSVLLLPPLLLWFGDYAWLSLPVNLLAVPLASFVIVPGAFLAAAMDWLWPVTEALSRMATGVDSLLDGGAWLAARAGRVQLGERPGWVWPLLVLASGLCLLPRGFPGRWLALPLLGLAVTAAPPRPPRLSVTFLEVGQGAATVVRTRDHVLIYDTGPSWSGGASAARFTLVPFLREQGVTRVDRLVVSHGDRDHAGGLRAVQEAVAVADLRSGEPSETGGRRCRRGMRWQWDGVHFRVLAPARTGLAGNAASCVLQVRSGELRVLLTGDIERAGERALARQLESPIDILQVAHHGSASSTSSELLQAAQPSLAVIPVGHDNGYDLPAPQVVQRLTCHGARVVSLAESGAVTVRQSTAQAWTVTRTRHRRLRLYHEQPDTGVQTGCQNRYDSLRSHP